MLGAARKTEVVITHTPHRQYSSAFAVPMFGRAEFGFTLDGERTPYTFGKDPTPQFYYTATQDGDDAVRIKIEDEKHRKDNGDFYKVDTIERDGPNLRHVQAWCKRGGEEVVRLEADLIRKSGK